MSCDITHGRLEQCKDIVGGLQAIYVLNFGEFDPIADVTYSATPGLEDLITIINFTSTYTDLQIRIKRYEFF
jgi:hypothetical protein